MIEISDTLREKLISEGYDTAKRQLGRVNKGPGAADESARRQVLATGGENGEGMTISEGRVYRSRPRLIVIDGGKR